ncbi:MAG: hypothetical protein JWQ50_5466, partial [Caballeronia mineralivorans]|nr:hypothetical protein [Caballeronia mineralivorans]
MTPGISPTLYAAHAFAGARGAVCWKT